MVSYMRLVCYKAYDHWCKSRTHRISCWHVRITLGSRVLKCYTNTYMHVQRTGACVWSNVETVLVSSKECQNISKTGSATGQCHSMPHDSTSKNSMPIRYIQPTNGPTTFNNFCPLQTMVFLL